MDKREKQVKDRLMQALIDIGLEKDFNQITVTDLIRNSGVARASFYRNFETVNDVIEYVVEKLHENFWNEAPKDCDSFINKEMLTYTFSYYQKYKNQILTFYRSGFSFNILDMITDNMILSYGDMSVNSKERYQIYSNAGAFYNTMLHWMLEGEKESPDELADIFMNLIVK